ncbi:LapA family protein [Hydrogenophaga sp.]|uniref:LapA family protein n=1 Tax=Hydrogenophaga sp. TaxID=1904254 RepID=UPI00262222C4|nr:LapA family protein [Hydrogenophaga sp.]MDM7949230.1 LapA family protein [Hydrogenophaga sp.]
MSLRTLMLVALILLMAGFVALNFEAIVQPNTLNLGFSEIQAPLGLVMLGMIVALLVVFLLALVYFQTSHLMEVRRITREASEQRQLADRAEASRFTELRELLRTEMQAVAARDAELSNQLMQKMDAVRAGLAETIELTGNGLGASLGELEDRFVRQFPPTDRS